jgi:hypothetical protein
LAAALAIVRNDALLAHGFGRALAASHAGLSFAPAAADPAASAATAGDEGFWLTRADVQSPAPFAKPLAVGDRITIAGSGGQERRLEVVAMRAVGGSGLGARGRLLLVSCRVAGEGQGGGATMVRFLIEAAVEKPVPPAAKAL